MGIDFNAARVPSIDEPIILCNPGSGGTTISLRPPSERGPYTRSWFADIESGDPLNDGFYEAGAVIGEECIEQLRQRLNRRHAALYGADGE